MVWRDAIASAADDFLDVARLAGLPITKDAMSMEFLTAPHQPPTRLPIGKMAVYCFWAENQWLKVGIAGPKSNARYTSQHYIAGSAPSTLAASLRADAKMLQRPDFIATTPGEWLKRNSSRANILFSAELPMELTRLCEAFLHLKLRPRYER